MVGVGGGVFGIAVAALGVRVGAAPILALQFVGRTHRGLEEVEGKLGSEMRAGGETSVIAYTEL